MFNKRSLALIGSLLFAAACPDDEPTPQSNRLLRLADASGDSSSLLLAMRATPD